MRTVIYALLPTLAAFLVMTGVLAGASPDTEQPLSGTKQLTISGEIDRQMIQGVSTFLDRKLAESIETRRSNWLREIIPNDREAFLREKRERLSQILGRRDPRPDKVEMQFVASTEETTKVFENDRLSISAVQWQACGQIYTEGLLLSPKVNPRAFVVAIPDADQTPEQISGLADGLSPDSQIARILAENGCQVLIPTVISRQRNQFEWNGRHVDVTNREFLYRSAFELGRHLIGYELQKVLSGIDWFKQKDSKLPIGVVGWGEGGLLALYAAALDERIDSTCVSGHFAARETIWRQPIDRNVFGLLNDFGDAQLATMVAPRTLIIEASAAPNVTLHGGPGAPAEIRTPILASVENEHQLAQTLVTHHLPGSQADRAVALINSTPDGQGTPYCLETRTRFLDSLKIDGESKAIASPPMDNRTSFDPNPRLQRQMQQIDRHTQLLLRESPYVRQQYMSELKTDSLDLHANGVIQYRKRFATDVIGRFDEELLPPNARTRTAYTKEKWTGYEVVLDVFPDVIAYGLLLVPNDIKQGEKRPVVVCQHGLEGRPQDTIGKESHHYYKAFAAQLAERGFVTFAPQNLYRHRDDFRVLQRKANPLGKTLFSIITPQHQQILNWLKTQPFVDGDRIGFYGLSYGGKTAMRVPALLPDYCLSICSADFNEWVDKNASTRNPRSYVWTGEYEIFEFDLGSTFNYAEMAALICPRPFMVERGHDDGVAYDETVAYEFAKVRRRYNKLGIGDRCEIEWFDGPHTINGKGTFAFLHRHLRWPEPRSK